MNIADDDIGRIKAFAGGRSEIAAVYLFGSHATGKARRGSDVDLAIVAAGVLEGMQRVRIETELCNLLRRDVEVIDFAKASPLLQHQILKYGRLIYEGDSGERIRQEVRARRHYLDGTRLYRKLGGIQDHAG